MKIRSTLRGLFSDLVQIRRDELVKTLTMAGLFFLIISTIGILKPIKNAFALDGLADSQFYKVYLISAVVVLFVVPYNRLANRVAWRRLIPAVAIFFAISLVAFRLLYRDGSTVFGVAFYGWYDLYSAVMVTQFFMATQLFFNARDAKRLYPLVIAGGSLGGVFGAAITGFFAERVGGPNLLLVAAALIIVFAAAIPLVWMAESRREGEQRHRHQEKLTAGEFTAIIRNKHVLLIAGAVLLTVLVKQLVDYQFNEITKEVFATRDAIGAFQGKFFAVTQWLPLLVLLALRPMLQRFGVGFVILLLPTVLLGANLALALSWSLVAAVMGKASDSAFRYTAERAGREILYVPVPDNIKLKAKAYIDMAVEKGLGKVLSSVLIFAAVLVIDYRKVGYIGVGLGVAWLAVALAVRKEYVRSLARSIQGRFASFQGLFASMADAATVPIIQETLESGDDRAISFAIDLIDQADPAGARPLIDNLHKLLDHPSPAIRERALVVLADFPEDADWARIGEKVEDPVESVRKAAVAALCRAGSPDSRERMKNLLRSGQPQVRMAALTCLADAEPAMTGADLIDSSALESRLQAAWAGDADAKVEVALTLPAIPSDRRVPDILGRLMRDPDARVAAAAVWAAGRLGRREFVPGLVTALGSSKMREAAREALTRQGPQVEGTLSDYLEDDRVATPVRRNIPGVMARLPAQATVDDLLRFLGSMPADRVLRYRVIKALNKLRARDGDLTFDPETVMRVLQKEVEAGAGYARHVRSLERLESTGPTMELLKNSLREAWKRGRERVFRYLGLLYPAQGIYRSYLTLENGGASARANAVEWLEQTIGRGLFKKVAPAVQEGVERDGGKTEVREVLRDLMSGDDVWVANCAAWTVLELREPWACEDLQRARASSNTELSYTAERALELLDADENGTQPESSEMNLIEKVFLLQQVDLLHDARSEELALLASIAEEIEVERGTVLLHQDEPTDALYVVIHGAVELRRAGEQLLTAQDGTPFGTWALIDEEPSLVGATAVEDTQLLRITREDFYDLLADYNELVRDLLKGLARRVRKLVA
ncbi:MAG: Npt1/Npt2 family nucleotide transporter [Gemmatimonadota bacterium]